MIKTDRDQSFLISIMLHDGGKSMNSPQMYMCNTIPALITDLMNGPKTLFNCQCTCMHNDKIFASFSFYLLGETWLSLVTDLKSLVMINKNCLTRDIEWNEESNDFAKLTETRVVSFGYWNFKIVEKINKKCQDVLQHITLYFKCIRLLCWYSMAVLVVIQCLVIRSWYWHRDLLVIRSWSWSRVCFQRSW